ncbi:GH92 family glycosyl hydrolase [Runella sp.]|uniref:GH92 family glycosyl hydrolase n=1 Tax=Runella sp. TaxID=1960881 RepID=UPI0026264B9F|nr:GH92 family glycosyl hydrolase [Runella sp.]
MNVLSFFRLSLFLGTVYCAVAQSPSTRPIDLVNPLMGSGFDGRISPIVSVPFGMVQLGADTRTGGSGYNKMSGSGYHYDDKAITGFSHVHKSGAGCGDFLDLLFVPLNGRNLPAGAANYPDYALKSAFSHDREQAKPGHYSVFLDDYGIKAELTATARCGFHRYSYQKNDAQGLLIDLKYGSTGACTIVKEDSYDTVRVSHLEVVDKYTVKGYRISNGFAPEQHVYFYTKFSKPIKSVDLFFKNQRQTNQQSVTGTDVKAVFYFEAGTTEQVLIKTALSSVDMEGAEKNLTSELKAWDFEEVIRQNQQAWNKELSRIEISDANEANKSTFYSTLYFTLMYPMLYSDVDGKYRGPDMKVHRADFPYYGQVVSIWDTFRGAVPLLSFLQPDVINDYVKTFLKHYDVFGQLPINVLAGQETFQMLGLHSIPIISDSYFKGIRGYDADHAFEAMKTSAMKDTSGFSMRYFVGLKNYKKYGYVPADLEMEAVARTLEYAYDDWSLAQMAKMLNKKADYRYFLNRASSYRNIFSKESQLMRGRFADGSWRTPFDPYASNHRRDDYCEGNAWQWSFFVPHDVKGLAQIMGGKEKLIARLDTLFSLRSDIAGKNTSGDITGLIGQYAHGNEPSHHTAYMYAYLGQPWKTQKYVDKIRTTLYNNSPTGLCGNDDTGQMSAWYVLSALGFYPVRHGDGTYVIGSPLFKSAKVHLPAGKILEITAKNLSKNNIYIQSVRLNGKAYNKAYFNHFDLVNNGKIEFTMGAYPNTKWAADAAAAPPSLADELKNLK